MSRSLNKYSRKFGPTLTVLLLSSLVLAGCGGEQSEKQQQQNFGPQTNNASQTGGAEQVPSNLRNMSSQMSFQRNENAYMAKEPGRPSSGIKSPILWRKQMDQGDRYAMNILEPEKKDKKPEPVVKLPDGLQFQDLEIGFGLSPSQNHLAMVHYTGYLADGTKFESSRDRGMPFSFIVGSGKVIRGFEEGIMSMKVGGRRRVVIPPSLAYGAEGHGDKVPANATLTYDIALLSCDR